jgi:exonuclease SbcC
LEIQGLTSFRDPQAIDFSSLNLFVIIGPTGSGKTSILDAVALALYGEVPRTGKKNAAELVTHGDSRARVLLEFQADGKAYRVARQLPRSGAQRATLERLAGDDWVTDVEESGVKPVNARIEAIIGLDFEAFTRAVLLPQGDFAKFLGGDARQRREILVRLLDLGRYESAGQLARQRADQLSNEISSRDQLIALEYANATEEALAACMQVAVEAEGRATALEKVRAEVVQAADESAQAERNLMEIGRDAETLTEASEALAQIARRWADLEPRERKAQHCLLETKTEFADAEAAHREVVAVLDSTRARDGDESLLAGLNAACGVTAQENAALADLTAQESSAEQEVGRLDRAAAQAAMVLANAQVRDGATRSAEEALQQDAGRVAEMVRKARDRAESEQRVAAAAAEVARWRDELEGRQQTLQAAEAGAAETTARLDHLKEEHTALAVRAGLTLGESCPVCLQPVGEIPDSPADIEASIAAATAEASAARNRERRAQSRANEALSEANTAVRMLGEATKALERLADAPEPAVAEAEAAALQERSAKMKTERSAATKALEDARVHCGEIAARVVGARTHRASLKREREGVEARLQVALTQLAAGFPTGIPTDPAGEIEKRRQKLTAAREAQGAARAKLDRAKQALDQASGARELLDLELAQLKHGCAEQRGALGRLAADRRSEGFLALPASQPAIAQEVDGLKEWIRSAETEIGSRRKSTETKRGTCSADLQRAAAAMGISVPSTRPADIRDAAQGAVTAAMRAAQHAANRLADVQERLVRRREIEEQIAQTRDRARLYRALADELRQNRFIDYVLGESMRQLATLASQELRGISAGRYSLSTEETSFVVVDHANADETRSVATLSGGETFLASLSLAMALAQSITDIAGEAIGSRLEAMFIDEGFGTLDADTLDIVIDALERLRDSERMVGVITHVSQLAERIPDGLAVERDGATSRIRPR